MSETKTAPGLILGKQYNFNICSSKKVSVEKVQQHHLIFRENYIEWVGEYTCTYQGEEDEEMGSKKDVNRDHWWHDTIPKINLGRVDLFRYHDEDQWGLKVTNHGAEPLIFYFYTKDKAQKICDLFLEYIFGIKPTLK